MPSSLHSPSPALLERIGLLGCGIICVAGGSRVYEGADLTASWTSSFVMLACYLFGFANLALATAGDKARRNATLVIPLSLCIVVWGQLVVRLTQIEQYPPLTTDVQMFVDYAARLVLDGVNPYATDLSAAYPTNQASLGLMTPLSDGSFTARLAYPSLSVLIFLPLQTLGISTQWTFLIAFLLAAALLYIWSPRALRPLVALALLIDPRYFQYPAGGVSDSVWALLLLLMLRFWKHPTWAAILFGLAASYKQQPWLLAPLLLVRLWHECDPGARRHRIGRFVGVSVATFFAINAPFIVWDPTAWARGVFEPALAPMITHGQGLSALSSIDMLGLSKRAHTLLMASCYATGVWFYFKHQPKWPALMWLVPGIALFFGNRSLTSYWYFYAIPLLADLAFHAGDSRELAPARHASTTGPLAPVRPPWWRRIGWPTVGKAALVTTVLLAVLFLLAHGKRPLELQLAPPMRAIGPMVRQIDVVVVNRSGRPIEPRFAAKSGAAQPFFWQIVSGPRRLRSGRTARYTIRAAGSWAEFDMRRGARLIVSDARAQSTRAGILVAPDRSFLRPDAVPNGHFLYWDYRRHRPTFWGLAIRSPGSKIELVTQKGASASTQRGAPHHMLLLELPAAPGARSLVIDTYIALPSTTLDVTIHLPDDANRLPKLQVLYGLRLMTDKKHVWILFGDRRQKGWLPSGERYLMLPATRGTWARMRVDLERLLKEAGLEIKARRVRVARFEYLDVPLVPLNFQLAVRIDPTVNGSRRFMFGPVDMSTAKPDQDRLYRRLRQRPQDLHRWLAAINLEQRNYRAAIEHYRAATARDPRDARAWLGLGEALFWQRRFDSAIAAYGNVVSIDPQSGRAFKGIGWACHALGRINEALLAWQRAERIFRGRPTDTTRAHLADTLKGMGMAQLRLGSCDLARLRLDEAHRLEPTIQLPNSELSACRKRTAGGSIR